MRLVGGRWPGRSVLALLFLNQIFFAKPIPESLQGLTDSKKVSAKKRDLYLDAILEHAAFASCVMLSSKVVDQLNINGAIEQAMMAALKRAENHLGLQLPHALLDGNYRFPKLTRAFPNTQFQSIVKGDLHVFSIAAASVLAKTIRDKRMEKYDRLFPGYEFARHKGYGTKLHRQFITKNGPCPIHRRSFRW